MRSIRHSLIVYFVVLLTGALGAVSWFSYRTTELALRERQNDALEAIKASGKTTLHYLTPEQRTAWQKAMAPTYKWAKGRVGQEILDLVAKELDIKMN